MALQAELLLEVAPHSADQIEHTGGKKRKFIEIPNQHDCFNK